MAAEEAPPHALGAKESTHAIAAKESIPQLVTEVFDAEAVGKLINTFFYEIDTDRSGQLDAEEFKRMMHKIGIKDDLLIERNFKLWDTDHDGEINFQEFVTGLSTMNGKESERLEMAFKITDLDGNGTIDRDEMLTVLKRALKFSHPELGPGEVSTIVLDLFRTAGVDPDDELTLEQFKKGVRSKKIVADCFRPTSHLVEPSRMIPVRKSSVGNPCWYKNL
eukprot:CAMPEP_0201475166 /NCGR_PEP_ID=MMETSP0151_2-20130828/611_1 /ASSEMBLY_ACC=CAM_ASM_000257 /TAXON_ID=200890 /ORGANISM="Paramoeba atlantica, Strain 621/1 / CCAP 1560/9" /LENGTH=220 /DNA_ID=CAMNT_0047855183 /DNA_START=79 /DNA_END=741 /DNA_ORIENTATION=+